MQKSTVSIIGLVMLIVGFGLGSVSGTLMQHKDTSMNMASVMHDMNAGLVGKTGDAFDQAFLAEMIVHHEGAVEMAELALVNAKHEEIKNLASLIIEAQNKEIAEMKMWQKDWYQQ